MPEGQFYECAVCKRAEREPNREEFLTIQVFLENRSGGRGIGSVMICGRQACWRQAMRDLRAGRYLLKEMGGA